jgi:hypothetical protein
VAFLCVLCDKFRKTQLTTNREPPAFSGPVAISQLLVFVEYQPKLELADRYIYCLNPLHPVPPKIMGGVLQWSFALRIAPSASRISGWGSGGVAGAAFGWGVAAGTAAAAGVLGAACVANEDQSANARTTTLKTFIFIFAP